MVAGLTVRKDRSTAQASQKLPQRLRATIFAMADGEQ